MKYDSFLKELARDKELARLIDKALEKKETGKSLRTILEYYYLKYLFIKDLDFTKVKNEIKKEVKKLLKTKKVKRGERHDGES